MVELSHHGEAMFEIEGYRLVIDVEALDGWNGSGWCVAQMLEGYDRSIKIIKLNVYTGWEKQLRNRPL